MQKAVVAMLIWVVSGSASPSPGDMQRVTIVPMPIDPADPAHVRFGRLHYLSGYVLGSKRADFGGYSSLHVDGDNFLTLADTGAFLSFRMARPGMIDQVRFGQLPDFPGRTGTKGDRDSESMAIDPASGVIWVGFEGYNAVFRYTSGFATTTARRAPPEMKDWPGDTGAESLARLSDGRFVILSENAPLPSGAKEALLFPGDPTDARNVPIRFGYRPPHGYLPTDAAELPDGRLIVLNRHFSLMDGLWAAVTIIDPRAVRPGEDLSGELLAEFRPPLNVDNIEGISVVREGGRTILWLISDDNQIPIQRTLLMKFALKPN